MAKLMLLKKAEVSVPEDKKGKQIAVKESNITSLKNFFVSNYKPPVEMPNVTTTSFVDASPAPVSNMESPLPIEVSPLNMIDPSIITPNNISEPEINPMNPVINNNIIEEPTPVIENIPAIETPIMSAPQPMVLESAIVEPMEPEMPKEITSTPVIENSVPDIFNLPTPIIEEDEEGTNDTAEIKLVQDNDTLSDLTLDEELDPELEEIKNRLDQVILDLNNYKKKIKMLENEVNQNLEKSREVLKDTQAAAKIMSIHQERQNQIMNELNLGTNSLDDSKRVLQKETI